ncbi:DUF1573 domain-containing protein [Aquimarina addita]|uniref:DUF1573 domain-containing protein n=1 Tax=Aquimarina addita TaxID=870485 RepID=A0ABP6URQ2_9FLAO
MKKEFLIAMSILVSIMASCNNSTKGQTSSASLETATASLDNNVLVPIMTFTETEHDFGTINEGDLVSHEFFFTNTGKAPLVIINAKGSCGCTVSQWPKKPIAPGAKASMLVSFNSKGKPNLQTKKITITANTSTGKETLKIRAMVTAKTK